MIPAADTNRIIFYYQTLFDQNGNLYSLQPIFDAINPQTGKPYTTTIQLAAFHFGYTNGQPYIHLNDNVPGDPMFDSVWAELRQAQSLGIEVSMMLGGAGGAYTELFNAYDTFYPILIQTLQTYSLNGVDLDIEETVTLANTEMLIRDLAADYPQGFITMAPVASELSGGGGLSGLNYNQLYDDVGSLIAWFNGQFYNGWGSAGSTADYIACINNGFPPQKVVLGMPGNPADGGGYVDPSVAGGVAYELTQQYAGQFGGVFSWEYFNTLPSPASWAQTFAQAMGVTPWAPAPPASRPNASA